jgi:hypothetical protein
MIEHSRSLFARRSARSFSAGAALALACLAGCKQGGAIEPANRGTSANAPQPQIADTGRTVADEHLKQAKLAVSRRTLADHRKEQITRLHDYAIAGVFPENPVASSPPVHMFKDPQGRRCAVANLIHLDGLDDVVDRMVVEHNDVVVADQDSGPLHDWVLTSGLTNEEVRRIQGAGFGGMGFGDAKAAKRVAEQMATQDRLAAIEKELVEATDASVEIALGRLEQSELATR